MPAKTGTVPRVLALRGTVPCSRVCRVPPRLICHFNFVIHDLTSAFTTPSPHATPVATHVRHSHKAR